METNYFQKLSEVKCITEKKNNLTYISWADAWAEVKKIHPEATYTIYENSDGNAFFESKYGIDCKVGVTINWIEHISRLPVMDGANKTLYFESYEYETKYGKKKAEAANAFDINKTIQRAFTKAIAMHWLWLYVYRGEDFPDEDTNKWPVTPPKVEKPYITTQNIKNLIKEIWEGTIIVSSREEALAKAQTKYFVGEDKKKELFDLYSKELL